MERRGLATATVVASDFLEMARVVSDSYHASNLPIVEVPSPFQSLSDAEIDAVARRVLPAVAAALAKRSAMTRNEGKTT